MGCSKNKLKSRVFAIVLIVVLCLSAMAWVFAVQEEKIVRVGWFSQEGYQEVDANGNYWGYNYEYLTDIAKITGWKYQFIEEDWATCIDMLEAGELDILGCMLYTPERAEIFDVPTLSCGTVHSSMFVHKDSEIRSNDFEKFNGITVACNTSLQNGKDFVQFAKENGFTFKFMDCDSYGEIVNAVMSGRADAGIVGSYVEDETTRIVAEFSPRAFYFMTTKGNEEVLVGLNRALNTIKIDNPFYDGELSVKYDQTEAKGFEQIINRLPKVTIISASLALLIIVAVLAVALIAKIRKSNDLREFLYKDKLTGLYSLAGFEKKARELLDKAPHGKFYAVIDFDINSFELYNSLYGFEKGDALLKAIADVALKGVGEDEACARVFGDRFVAILTGRNAEDILLRAQTMNETLREIMENRSILISYGIYEVKDRRTPVKTMCDHAAAAKNTVKGDYADFIAIYDETLHNRRTEDALLVRDMARALETGEFTVYYQPKYDIYSKKIVGAEALIRWIRPNGKMITPDRFIKLFEDNGLIRNIDWFVVNEVCKAIKSDIAQGLPIIPISINFSRGHLYNRSFADNLAETVRKQAVPTELIEVEFTENMFLGGPESMTKTVDKLHSKGFAVAIDDFGSGYSSLNMLKEVHFDTVKIDRGFLQTTKNSERSEIIIQEVISLASRLNMKTVAEGVENAEQLKFLSRCGCDVAQGFYFSKPVPLDIMREMVKKNRERY